MREHCVIVCPISLQRSAGRCMKPGVRKCILRLHFGKKVYAANKVSVGERVGLAGLSTVGTKQKTDYFARCNDVYQMVFFVDDKHVAKASHVHTQECTRNRIAWVHAVW